MKQNIENELQALTNALISFGLANYEILDSELGRNKYCLRDSNHKCLTGWWNYDQLNHFIMGYGKAYNKFINATP